MGSISWVHSWVRLWVDLWVYLGPQTPYFRHLSKCPLIGSPDLVGSQIGVQKWSQIGSKSMDSGVLAWSRDLDPCCLESSWDLDMHMESWIWSWIWSWDHGSDLWTSRSWTMLCMAYIIYSHRVMGLYWLCQLGMTLHESVSSTIESQHAHMVSGSGSWV